MKRTSIFVKDINHQRTKDSDETRQENIELHGRVGKQRFYYIEDFVAGQKCQSIQKVLDVFQKVL